MLQNKRDASDDGMLHYVDTDPRNRCPTYWDNINDPVVLLETYVYSHPLTGRTISASKLGKGSKLEVSVFPSKSQLVLVR